MTTDDVLGAAEAGRAAWDRAVAEAGPDATHQQALMRFMQQLEHRMPDNPMAKSRDFDPRDPPELAEILRANRLSQATRFAAVCGPDGCVLLRVIRLQGRDLLLRANRRDPTTHDDPVAGTKSKHERTTWVASWLDEGIGLPTVACRHRTETLIEPWLHEQIASGKKRAVLRHAHALEDGTPSRWRSRRNA